MYGRPSQFQHPHSASSGGSDGAWFQQPQHMNGQPNLIQHLNPLFQTNPLVNVQSPQFQQQYLNHAFNPHIQNQDFNIQSTNFQTYQSPNFVHALQNPAVHLHNPLVNGLQPQSLVHTPRITLKDVECAVAETRQGLLASEENVSASKVAQATLLTLKVDSWDALGVQLQEVPSLRRIMITEGKVNLLIHCFVGAHNIASLSELEAMICQEEGLKSFEELELGPLLRHPLVIQYFAVNSYVREVHKITHEAIIQYICLFVEKHQNEDVKVEAFLDFVAKRRSVTCREKLTIRIQNLRWYINVIGRVKKASEDMVNKKLDILKKRPFITSKKKELDNQFKSISQRVELFSSQHQGFCGQHIRFVSSSSEDESSKDVSDDEIDDIMQGCPPISLKSCGNLEQATSCPYPSATEEIKRLGLRRENNLSTDNNSMKLSPDGHAVKRRKTDKPNSISSRPSNLSNKSNAGKSLSCEETVAATDEIEANLLMENDGLQTFLSTWKEACKEHNVGEVLDKMLLFYGIKPRQKWRKRNKSIFSSYPFIGLLNVAVSSIKSGMWDSIYDAFQASTQNELTSTLAEKEIHFGDKRLDIEPFSKSKAMTADHDADAAVTDSCLDVISAEDIIQKIRSYFNSEEELHSASKSLVRNQICFVKKLCRCESWLTDQFCVRNFSSLGFGDFFIFLEKHVSFLPDALQKFLVGDVHKENFLEACMLSDQLLVLVSQAVSSSWECETVNEQMISSLLSRQFPSIGFKVVENGSLDKFLHLVEKNQHSAISKSILFSATLVGTNHIGESLAYTEDDLSKNTPYIAEKDLGKRVSACKNAGEVLLRAPLLSDLRVWSHWEVIFAPSLGPLVTWLLDEFDTNELCCLVTNDGKVVRIDHTATPDTFLEAVLKGSSFHAAVQLLSLFTLFGGQKQVTSNLLKHHAHQAFQVKLRNSLENSGFSADVLTPIRSECLGRSDVLTAPPDANLRCQLSANLQTTNEELSALCGFFLDCLGYLPSECWNFGADVLLYGLKSLFKGAASAILCECNKLEHRIMLHDVGLSLGIIEWIDDYHAFVSTYTTGEKEIGEGSEQNQGSRLHSSLEAKMVYSITPNGLNESCMDEVAIKEKASTAGSNDSGSLLQLPVANENSFAVSIIKSIRSDEFGLGPDHSGIENSMVEKQHARLGRALNCLSQELYSQDSHFILELVQNADDNSYPENVEPTLTFILQDTGIIVLNNEKGFSAHNIRALCDVGNSTKKGHNTGYIGKKGIGFKSVFRVTDAPEIHSNGFHVKFDIGEGQIGFVLPTIVPPCDVDLFNRMVSTGGDSSFSNCWNTCIVLPFRSRISETTAVNSIISMFSDLHPSLLLFLHRLQCIKFRNLLTNSLIVMRKETMGHGLVRVLHGNDKTTWFVVSKKLRADSFRSDAGITEISLAFTLEESNKNYSPCLDQQPVFAFLPLRTYGLRFILQGDFVLPSSREEVDGNSPWNQWLLSEYPNLFVDAERDFCALPHFKDNPGKAVSTYMNFVPLAGEVHGFFSSLPRLIICKLRMSNCLLAEGMNEEWIPPCKGLRGWSEQVRLLLPDDLLQKHLGLRYLHKDVVISDQLARALGVKEYGSDIFLNLISSLCTTNNCLTSIGLNWLASCLNALYIIICNSSVGGSTDSESAQNIVKGLQKMPFIPLSDGTHSSIDEGNIWLQSVTFGSGLDMEIKIEYFPTLSSKLRTVSSSLLSASATDISGIDVPVVSDNVSKMLQLIGVKQLSAHEIVKLHILPAFSEDKMAEKDHILMVEYMCFVMIHLRSACNYCCTERGDIISGLQHKPSVLTNYGSVCPAKLPIHFPKDFGNPVDPSALTGDVGIKWHELDVQYSEHPVNKLLPQGLNKWREFFQELGVTDFVQVTHVEKDINDVYNVNGLVLDKALISPETLVSDWESHELEHLLSLLSEGSKRDSCKYLLEIFDTQWDTCYLDKTTGCFYSKSGESFNFFTSRFILNLCNSRWVASSLDNELHYPKDLFYDCQEVRMLLGECAPYAVPKVKSQRLINDIGFKTKVSVCDALDILRVWREHRVSFKASISQMSRLYAFLWNEMATSRQKIVDQLDLGPFIFVPYSSVSSSDDIVAGTFFSGDEVCWHDLTGTLDMINEINPYRSLTDSYSHIKITLSTLYQDLHGFFVDQCRVNDTPPLCNYLQILRELSVFTSPSQASSKVYQVFVRWAEGLSSGLLSSDDIICLREKLSGMEFSILPTDQDTWVSLHPSFGLVCWCDDENLRKQFKKLVNVHFIYFGDCKENEKVSLQSKVSILLKELGIAALSEAVTRQAVYDGMLDCSFIAPLVNWALPCAQRYIYGLHSDQYYKLKQCGFDIINSLKVIAVEKLYYRNVIKTCGILSEDRVQCTCLLQDCILYVTRESDFHTLYMELSSLFFDGKPELHLANFLHMITTMVKSGFSERQTDHFISTNQRLPKLPDVEPIWCLLENATDKICLSSQSLAHTQIFSNRNARNLLPEVWGNPPGISSALVGSSEVQAAHICNNSQMKDNPGFIAPCANHVIPGLIGANCTIKDELNQLASNSMVVFQQHHKLEGGSLNSNLEVDARIDPSIGAMSNESLLGASTFGKRDQPFFGQPTDLAQAVATGRLGEQFAYKYLVEKFGAADVKWVNEVSETRLPYDLVIRNGKKEEYIEVKATTSLTKDWFFISRQEWKFAVEKSESYSIAFVVLGNYAARVSMFKNPAKLCELGELKLVITVPKERTFSIIS